MATAGLTRRFGQLVAVNDLSVTVPSGGVVGLVGPNGSGKSTLIRMLLGLIRPTAGTAQVLGVPISRPDGYAAAVGALIESPAFVPALSARQNLRSLAVLRGLPGGRVEEVLRIVGLTGRDREPVRRFSLGMKQRLGIAAALLPDPSLLILDEPTNGLDPAGIVEMRDLLRSLGAEGRTVVVSSHLLSEIEQVCTHLVVIRFGQLMFAGPIGDLLDRATSWVDAVPEHDEEAAALREALTRLGWVTWPGDAGVVRVQAGDEAAARINRAAAQAGITLRGLTVVRDDLERVFLSMTGDNSLTTTDGAAGAAR